MIMQQVASRSGLHSQKHRAWVASILDRLPVKVNGEQQRFWDQKMKTKEARLDLAGLDQS